MDREKVIKAYECCKNPFDRKCEKCPYEKDCCHDGIPMFVIKKMVALLKEQEVVEPVVEVINEVDRLYRCPKCYKCFFYGQKYCDQCGLAVKWE